MRLKKTHKVFDIETNGTNQLPGNFLCFPSRVISKEIELKDSGNLSENGNSPINDSLRLNGNASFPSVDISDLYLQMDNMTFFAACLVVEGKYIE